MQPLPSDNTALEVFDQHPRIERPCAVASPQLPPVSACVGPVYEPSEVVPQPGMQTTQSCQYPASTPYPIQTPATTRQGYLQTPPIATTRALNSPVITPVTSVMVTPASAVTILPVSPIRTHFGFPMTQMPTNVVPGEGTIMAKPEVEMEDDVEDADIRTEIGSPDIGIDAPGAEPRLPPIRSLPPLPSYGPGPETMSVAKQTRLAMCGGSGISRNVLLYKAAGLPPILSHIPPRQATFFGVQSVPVADGSGHFATICAPPRTGVPIPVSSHPVYPPAGVAPLIAGCQGLPHGGLTAPIKHGDELAEWKEQQRAKERADVVVKDGELL
ncbi:hypothetical protein FRC07_008584 [Ceratobasidium sp. 392]|nr:hypothetical protein FRC07_008584 [Ceratobasidium sp. 392]